MRFRPLWPLLWAEQNSLFSPRVLQLTDHLGASTVEWSLHSGDSKLDTVLQLCSHKWWMECRAHFPRPLAPLLFIQLSVCLAIFTARMCHWVLGTFLATRSLSRQNAGGNCFFWGGMDGKCQGLSRVCQVVYEKCRVWGIRWSKSLAMSCSHLHQERSKAQISSLQDWSLLTAERWGSCRSWKAL